MKTTVFLGIHAVFLCVYLGVLGAYAAGWEDTRNVVSVVGLGLAGLGLMACGVLWSLASLCRDTSPGNWRALGMLGIGLCFLVTATGGARWIASNRQAVLVGEREQARQRDAERQRQAAIQAMIERQPVPEVRQAKKRSAILKTALAGRLLSLIDSVRSGLDGSRIDALQDKIIRLDAEIGSFNPYASAAAFERNRKLDAELAKAQDEQRAAIAAIQRQAEDLVLAAVEKGDLPAFRQIEAQIARRPRAFSEAERLAFARASPERLKQERGKRCRNWAKTAW